MKDKLDKLLELLETALFDPFRFAGEMEPVLNRYGFVQNLIAFSAALSIAAGAVYITPPYSRGSLIRIGGMTLIYYFFFMIAPRILAAVTEQNILKKKERKSRQQLLGFTAALYLALFILFTPVMIILGQAELFGGLVYFLFLTLFMLTYLYMFSQAVTAYYEVEMKIAVISSLKAAGLMVIFPVLFNFLFISSLIGLVQ